MIYMGIRILSFLSNYVHRTTSLYMKMSLQIIDGLSKRPFTIFV